MPTPSADHDVQWTAVDAQWGRGTPMVDKGSPSNLPILVSAGLGAAILAGWWLCRWRKLRHANQAKRTDVVKADIDDVVPSIIERLNRNPDEIEDADDRPQAIFMDFAGQSMYYLMHHIFISPELAIYLVVFSLELEPSAELVSLKRLLDESPWLQFTCECQRF
jgi:hypothetical protein